MENALSEQRNANAELLTEIEKLKREADTKSDEMIVELDCTNSAYLHELDALKADAEKAKSELKEKLANEIEAKKHLEEEVSNLKKNKGSSSDSKEDLEERLTDDEKSKSELEERRKKVNAERWEVITALEEAINEVQSREEEIESLAHILRKRDEELEHAKLIATKALASSAVVCGCSVLVVALLLLAARSDASDSPARCQAVPASLLLPIFLRAS